MITKEKDIMVIGLIGESCTGKSSIGQALKESLNAEIITGKDYLKMAKSRSEAEKKFSEYLIDMQGKPEIVVYVISETDSIGLLPDKAMSVHCKAPLDVIKERFAVRMHGNLPAPVATMLERKHGIFDKGKYDLEFDTSKSDLKTICTEIVEYCGKALK